MMDAARPQTGLGDLKSAAWDDFLPCECHMVESHLAMAKGGVVVSKDGKRALDDDVGMGQRHDHDGVSVV
jgi:hypothetical protein